MAAQIVNPNERLCIPDWINAEYFEKIVAQDVPASEKIIDCKTVAAIPPGENFTSVMLRVYLQLEMKDGSQQQKRYILKTMLDDEKGGELIKEMRLFPKEMQMYETYLPAFEELYRKAGRDVQIVPKCLFVEQKGNRFNFVFEDLSEQRYVNTNRLVGFDMPHMRRILQKLAEYHAASAVYAEQHGPYPDDFNFGFINVNGAEVQKAMFQDKISAYKNAMATWCKGEEEIYIEKLPSVEQYWACASAALKPDPNGFNVLNHGDFWSSNVMFKYQDEITIDKVLFLDFQLCNWGNPAQDLLFFITLSAAKDIRIKEFDHFVQIYHESLIDCLKLLGYKRPLPKLRELQIAMYHENATFYAFFAAYNHLPIILWPTDANSNLEFLSRKDEAAEQLRMRIFTNPPFVEQLREIMAFYHRRGLFNLDDF